MELIGREIEEDSLWYTLPSNKGWEDTKAGGIDLDMTALRKGNRLEFLDPYRITWQIALEPVFHASGDFTNRRIFI